MTARQASPNVPEGEGFDEERVDLDSITVVRPTLQAVLWLSELIATTALQHERVRRKGPRYDQAVAVRHMHDIAAQAQTALELDCANLISVTVAMARILIIVMSLVVKLGTQDHI